MQIQGYDIDGDMIKAARQNAEDAGVLDYIHFQQRPVSVKPCEKVRFCHYEPAVRRASGGEKGSAWPVSGVLKGLCGIR